MSFPTPRSIEEMLTAVHKHEYLMPVIQHEFVEGLVPGLVTSDLSCTGLVILANQCHRLVGSASRSSRAAGGISGANVIS